MKIYENHQGNIYVDCDDTLDIVASKLGLKATRKIKELDSLIISEIMKNDKFLSTDEIKDNINYWDIIYEYSDDELLELKDKLLDEMNSYIFISEAQYRGGEKVKQIAFKIYDDPIQKAADFNDWPEYWELLMDEAQPLYDTIIEIRKFLLDKKGE